MSDKQQVALDYAQQLTTSPGTMTQELVNEMHDKGWDDGEVLEINQVAAYFNYANRTVLGLGINMDGDIVGLSPNQSDDPDNWNHT